MAGDPKAVAGQGQGTGGVEPPAPVTTPDPTPVSTPPLTEEAVRRIISEGLAPVNDAVRKLYTRTDNNQKATERTNTALKDLMAEVRRQEAAGLEGDDAVNAATSVIDARQKQAERDAKIDTLISQQTGSAADPVKVAEVVKPYGFAADDVEANALIQQYGNNPETLDGRLAKLALQRARTSPSDAQGAAPVGRTPPQEKEDPRIAQLDELQKHPARNRLQIKKLKAELDAEGWGQKS